MRLFFALIFAFISLGLFSQGYFPPTDGSDTWETTDPLSLGYCQEKIDSLYAFLETTDTKGFIMIKEGRIVMEQYFNGHDQDAFWYWASAGKSLTAYLVGVAQSQGLLDIEQPSSDFLGLGWTVAPPEKEILIKIRNQMSMTTGLADREDLSCLSPECLEYQIDAGERWSYMSQGSRLLSDVLEEAAGSSVNGLTSDLIGESIGMGGFWLDYVRYSTTRDMARFGLLALNESQWNGTALITAQDYLAEMTSTSQPLNLSYGYLWWLNGQESHLLPGFDFTIPSELIPIAPEDMYAALGKNDQKIYVIPSLDMVVIRTGNAGESVLPGPGGYDNDLWTYLSDLSCESVGIEEVQDAGFKLYPNPATNSIRLQSERSVQSWVIMDLAGHDLLRSRNNDAQIDLSPLEAGPYIIQVMTEAGLQQHSFIKE
jgi:CubicO group peptidase (beta-lactamase class C family)